MRYFVSRRHSGFTLIELMVGIVLTVMVTATFFRFFDHMTTASTSNSYKTATIVRGDVLLDSFGQAVELSGLTTTNAEFLSSVPRVILESQGTISGTESVSFVFTSPFGGPITKVSEETNVSGIAPNCQFAVLGTAANSNTIRQIRIITKDDIYYGNVQYFNNGWVLLKDPLLQSNGTGHVVGSDCKTIFPEGAIVTGPNYFYRLKWSPTTALKFERVLQPIPFSYDASTFSSGSETLFDVPHELVPLVILQFLRLDPISGSEVWEDGRSYATEDYRDVKAVRIAIVLLPQEARDLRGESDSTSTMQFCPFESAHCYTVVGVSRVPMMFKKVIYVRNIDYLQKNQGS